MTGKEVFKKLNIALLLRGLRGKKKIHEVEVAPVHSPDSITFPSCVELSMHFNSNYALSTNMITKNPHMLFMEKIADRNLCPQDIVTAWYDLLLDERHIYDNPNTEYLDTTFDLLIFTIIKDNQKAKLIVEKRAAMKEGE